MAPTPMQVAELSKIRFRETPEYLGCDGPLLIHRDGTSECRGSCHGEPRHDRYHGPHQRPRVLLCQPGGSCVRCR